MSKNHSSITKINRIKNTTMRKRQRKSKIDSRRRRIPKSEFKHKPMPQEPHDEDRFYVIEQLLDKRYTANGGEEYLVRWQNYNSDWDSWEPRKEIERNALAMINEYNRFHNCPNFDADPNQLHCICQRPYKFEDGGMIQCFYCLEWYHFACLQMNMEEANSYAKYYCSDCKRSNPRLKCMIKGEKLTTFYGMSLVHNDDNEFCFSSEGAQTSFYDS